MRYYAAPKSGNPSSIEQDIQPFRLNILCCHYWWLEVWKHLNLSYPYWRLYWNDQGGAEIYSSDRKWELTEKEIILIPPNTTFSTFYDPNGVSKEHRDHLVGGPLFSAPQHHNKQTNNDILHHLFIHFTLGGAFNHVKKNIFRLKASEFELNNINKLCSYLEKEPIVFDRQHSLLLEGLIINILAQIPESSWNSTIIDERVSSTINRIDKHLNDKLTNAQLAKQVNMATNSFARLFSTEIGEPLQQYILRRRVEHACMLLHHTADSIDEIALSSGFCDRYHFTRMFKKITGNTPGNYRSSYKFYSALRK